MSCHGGGTWKKSAYVTVNNSAGEGEQTVATCEVSGCLVARETPKRGGDCGRIVETLMALRTLRWRRQCVYQGLDTVNVETAAEATLLQREAAPLSRNYCVVTGVGTERGCDITTMSALGRS